jgi:hypothetical protein
VTCGEFPLPANFLPAGLAFYSEHSFAKSAANELLPEDSIQNCTGVVKKFFLLATLTADDADIC